MYWPNSRWTWTFFAVVVVQAIVIIALEAYAFALLEVFFYNTPSAASIASDPQHPYPKEVPTSLTLYIFAMIYWLYLTWDALRMKNTIQIIGLCISDFALVIYGAVQTKQVKDIFTGLAQLGAPVDPNTQTQINGGLVAIPIVLAFGAVLMSVVAVKLYDEFAWTIYKNISADLRMKQRFLTYQIYIALLKFDFFFFLGFCVQFVAVVITDYGDPEFGLTIAAIPITIVFLLLAALWARRENVLGMILVIIVYFAAAAYFIFKLVRIWSGPKVQQYFPVSKPLTAFAALTLPLIFVTIAVAIMVTVNFGKGLKPHLSGRAGEVDEEEKHYMNAIPQGAHGGGPVPSRMVIE